MDKVKIDEKLAALESNESCMVENRLCHVLKMTSVAIVAGANSLLKVAAFWNDKTLAEIAGLECVPDDSTLGRAFKRGNYQTVIDFEAMQSKLRNEVCNNFLSPVLAQSIDQVEKMYDVDGSAITSFGSQEGSMKGYNPHKKGANCFQSLIAIDPLTKTVSLAWLQSGNTHCANGSVDFVRQLHSLYPKQKKFFRFDSGFYCGKLMEELEKQESGYLIKAKLKGLEKKFNQLTWSPVKGGKDSKEWEEATFYHICKGWNKPRKFSVVRKKVDEVKEKDTLFPDHVIDKYVYFCYICTKELTPWKVHKLYGKRAVCENYIEELKNQMGLGKMKSGCFTATSLQFHCSILAYNLIRWMTVCLGKARIFKWEISSIRCFLIRVAGKISRSSRTLSIFMDKEHFYQDELDLWMSFCL